METNLIKFLQSGSNVFFDVFFISISFLASFFGFIFLFFIFFLINKKHAIYFAFVYSFVLLFNSVLKILINRARPYEIDDMVVSTLSSLGKSFPSGHMAGATVMVFFIVALIIKKCTKTTKILSIILGCLFLVLVSISRMYLGQHYLSDTIAGFFISAVLCVVFYIVLCLINKKLCKQKK